MRHDDFEHKTNGIGRSIFGVSVITNQSKLDLSKREQVWLVGPFC